MSQKEKKRGDEKVERAIEEQREEGGRDQTGRKNFNEGQAKQHRFEQGGGGGGRGGGGGTKKGLNDETEEEGAKDADELVPPGSRQKR